MADPRGLVIAAPASGAGKTLVTLALLRALTRQGKSITSAKAGPDYIDPRFHEAASGGACFNLDCWAMREGYLAALAQACAGGSELVLIEGVMGLFDGAAGGGGTTADLARALGLPVILVVDAQRQGRSAAALVKGFAEFEAECDVAGVIFNRVTSASHAAILSEAVQALDMPVLGAVPETREIAVPSRHLGLVQASEHAALDAFLNRAADLVDGAVDLDALGRMAKPLAPGGTAVKSLPPLGRRIAVARDEAFSFSYPHLLHAWRDAGAQIMPFSPLGGEAPDGAADAIYLPGGYPELHAGQLAANRAFMDALGAAAARGALIYGECGGFMTLGQYLIDAEGIRHRMAGLLPLGTSFAKRGLKLGYRRLTHTGALPWPEALRGHEFHYSTLHWQGEADALFEARDSRGENLGEIGLRRDNVMGSYAHIIDMEGCP
ncbi:cobyrinic acid A,C-diamide synthase [bacterium BMS3Bbin10]|nr:cobyrinic acid A,C-diamide synthase [bacterium BMS3Bbin10]